MEHKQSTYLLTNILKCGNRPMIKLNDLAKRLGVSVNTSQRWVERGISLDESLQDRNSTE